MSCGMFPFSAMYSKAEQILSRYRPIAPKPPAPKQEGFIESVVAAPETQSSSSVSSGCRKGSRKRAGAVVGVGVDTLALASPKPSKRPAKRALPQQQQQQQQRQHQAHQDIVNMGMEVNRSSVTMSAGYELLRTSPVLGNRFVGDTQDIFLRNPPLLMQQVVKVPFELFRPATGDAYGRKCNSSVDGPAEQNFSNVGVVPVEGAGLGDYESCSYAATASSNGEHEACDCRPKLVTLSLLPDTPSNLTALSGPASELSNCQKLKHSTDDEDQPLTLRLGHEERDHFVQLSEQRVPELQVHQEPARTTIDIGYLEQVYGTSPDPLMLTGEGNIFLWSNLAYKKVIAERLSGRSFQGGPYIDPVGMPTQMGLFSLRGQLPLEQEISATLWGFLKKFVFAGQGQAANERNNQVIAPRALRVGGSSVCLESIIKSEVLMNGDGELMMNSLQSVQAHLEKEGSPAALVTDETNRVRWVNSTYRHMVIKASSSPSSSNSSSSLPVSSSSSQSPPSSPINKIIEVAFMWRTEDSPYRAVRICGRARIEGLNGVGKRFCLASVPCEMRRFEDSHNGILFVWTISNP